MKRFTYFIILFLSTSYQVFSQDVNEGYSFLPTPIQEDDVTFTKTWKVHYRYADGSFRNIRYILDSEREIGGKTYSCIVSENDTLFFREENDRLYCKTDMSKADRLVLNMNPEEESTFSTDFAKELSAMKKGNWEEENYHLLLFYDEPSMLNVQTPDGHTDTWMEGIGSLEWGIIPTEIAQGMESIGGYGEIVSSRLIYGWHLRGPIEATFDIDEEDYKLRANRFEEASLDQIHQLQENGKFDYVRGHTLMECTFSNDTLCVTGFSVLNCYQHFVSCILDGSSVKVEVYEEPEYTEPYYDCENIRYFEARFPGFKAGTYIVNGQELVCEATTDVKNIKTEPDNSGQSFDLQGRQLKSAPQKGIYIQDGKKVLVK